jgi:hypothetical protein
MKRHLTFLHALQHGVFAYAGRAGYYDEERFALTLIEGDAHGAHYNKAVCTNNVYKWLC